MPCSFYGANKNHKCWGCGKALVGRQEKWCSYQCSDAYWENHSWSMARKAAKKRDGYRCVRCGLKKGEGRPTGADEWEAFIVFVTNRIRGDRYGSRWLGYTVSARQWKKWSQGVRLEVNHKTPIHGKHSTNGCHHHLDGLETLCNRCHLDETNRQFGRGIHKQNRKRKFQATCVSLTGDNDTATSLGTPDQG